MIKHKRKYLFGLIVVILIIVLAIILGRPSSKYNLAKPASKNTASQKVQNFAFTVKDGQVIKGSSTITVKAGQEFKVTVTGLGYGEGDNLVIQGFPSSFFDLDELDGPSTQYVTINKPGNYPLLIKAVTDTNIGSIVVR